MVDIESKHLTASNVGYWLKAKEWSARRAGMLLNGTNPGYWEFPRLSEQGNLSFIDIMTDQTLAEIVHIKGRAVEDEWDNWSPRQWMDAATEAGVEIHPLLVEVAGVNDQPSATDEPHPRTKTALLNIIGSMLHVFLMDTDDDGKPFSTLGSQSKLIEIMLDRHPGKDGISESNLKTVFAKANSSLKQS